MVNSHMRSHPEYAGDEEGHTDEDSLGNASGASSGPNAGGGSGGNAGVDLLRNNMMQDDAEEGHRH